MKALGLNWKQDAMRHTFATYHMAKYGIDKTRRILGHSTNNIMFDFYIGLSENLEKEANRFFDPKRKTEFLKSTKA
jgi:integrase